MPFYLNNLKKNIIFKIKNNFTTTWNKMKDDSTVFLLGYIFCAPINYLQFVVSHYISFLMTTILCVSKNSAQDIYAYDHALKFSMLQENPSLKQTETPNC